MTDVSRAPAAPRTVHTAGRAGRAGRHRVRPARNRIACLRMLVLLLALLMPGGPVAAYGAYGSYGSYAVPLPAVAGGADAPTGNGGPGCTVAEHDTPDPAPRVSVRGSVRGGGPPLRPTLPSTPGPAHTADRPAHAGVASRPPHSLHALRCVVLRC